MSIVFLAIFNYRNLNKKQVAIQLAGICNSTSQLYSTSTSNMQYQNYTANQYYCIVSQYYCPSQLCSSNRYLLVIVLEAMHARPRQRIRARVVIQLVLNIKNNFLNSKQAYQKQNGCYNQRRLKYLTVSIIGFPFFLDTNISESLKRQLVYSKVDIPIKATTVDNKP